MTPSNLLKTIIKPSLKVHTRNPCNTFPFLVHTPQPTHFPKTINELRHDEISVTGNSALNIPNMNPMEIPKISVKQGNRQIGLNMEVSDVKIYGMESMKTVELK